MIKNIIYIVEIATIFLFGFLCYKSTENIDINNLVDWVNWSIYALSGLYILYGLTPENNNDNKIITIEQKKGSKIVKLLSFITLAVLIYGCSLMILTDYEGQFFSIFVAIIAIILAIILLIQGEKNSNSLRALPRLIMAITITAYIYTNMFNFVCHNIKDKFIENICGGFEVSQQEGKIIAAWYDINNLYNKEMVLNAYSITEEEYNQKADSLVFGSKENIPQKRKIELISNDFKDKKVKDLISVEDQKYYDSLRPIFQKRCFDDRALEVIDLYNLALYSQNKELKKYLINNFKWYCIHIKTSPESYYW